jgi:tripartite-type tricarboxylate transporter receptor subunit TctC
MMSIRRREILRLAGAAAAAQVMPHVAFAVDYPTRPVRIVVPYGPGSVPDITARLLAQWLAERLGQPFVVENRPGAGGNLGTEAVAQASPDGYTLLAIAAANMINPSLYDKLNFNFIRDIAPVASVGRAAHVIAVHPSIPVDSIPELIAYARTNPGKLNEGSLTGASVHMAAEFFKMSTGVNIVHVPYRTGALTDLLSGQLQISFDSVGVLGESVKSGKLRGLAVTTPTRWDGLPHLPTVGDSVPRFEVTSAGGMGAPKSTPPEIIEKLNREINAYLTTDKFRARMADLGAEVLIGSPADFAKLIAAETEKWAKVLRIANIKPE